MSLAKLRSTANFEILKTGEPNVRQKKSAIVRDKALSLSSHLAALVSVRLQEIDPCFNKRLIRACSERGSLLFYERNTFDKGICGLC